MNSITNVSRGARILNAVQILVRDGKRIPATQPGTDATGKPTELPVVEAVHIAPGETKDVEILNMDDPVFKGMVEAGDLIVGKEGEKPPTPKEKAERDAANKAAAVEAARKAGYDEGYAKAQAEAAEAAKKKLQA